jgi:hypothetical protein
MNNSHHLVAPCGINCSYCRAHLRTKNPCSGCRAQDGYKLKHCSVCNIRNCSNLHGHRNSFCFSCNEYPCVRLQNMDSRYRTRYGISVILNLNEILKNGLANFSEKEKVRWTCSNCGFPLCIHKDSCQECGVKITKMNLS